MNHLSGDFFDMNDWNKYPNLGTKTENNEFIGSQDLQDLLADKYKTNILLQSVRYGLYRYENEYGSQALKIPDLSLYHQYTMRDVALVCNYTKKHSAFRGQGLLTFGNQYFLFIELHKQEEAIAYRDKFLSPSKFQWDSPNSSSQDKGQGYQLVNHESLGINLHFFVRKFKEIDGVIQPYIYIGQGSVYSHEGDKPILFKMNLDNKVPVEVYSEFVVTTDSTPQNNQSPVGA